MKKQIGVLLCCLIGSLSMNAGGYARPAQRNVTAEGVPAASAAAVQSDAMTVTGVSLAAAAEGTRYYVRVEFSQSIATAAGDASGRWGGSIYLNDVSVTKLKENDVSVSAVYEEAEGKYRLKIDVPASCLKRDGTDKILLKKGFTGESGYVTTADILYRLPADGGAGTRIYRLGEDSYGETGLIGISSPSKNKGAKENMKIKLYMDKALSPRKLVNMQFWYKSQFEGLMLPEFPVSATEISSFFNFGIVGVDNADSLLYKIQIGADKFNGLTSYGTETRLADCGEEKGLQLYDLKTLMYSANSSWNSTMALSVQVHYTGNVIELYLKGDDPEDRYNISPDAAAETNMVIRLKKGLLFPTGVMLKEDVTYYWSCAEGKWTDVTSGSSEKPQYIDDTLNNQGGYTDEELAAAGR